MNWRYKPKMAEDADEEKYFDDDSDKEEVIDNNRNNQEDPLDAFMRQIHQQQPNNQIPTHANPIEQQDEEVYAHHNTNKPIQHQNNQEEFSEEDNNHLTTKTTKKNIEVLKPFNFNEVDLDDFNKDFYAEHQEITNLTTDELNKILKQYQIKISGKNVLRPIISFGHLPLGERLIKLISKNQYQKPTPIQAQALPCALAGRDIVGIAKTGSGKTLAYVWPMIIHSLAQRRSQISQGPIGLVLAPTRQLCQQIYIEIKKYTKKTDLKVACLLGGQNKHDQWKTLRGGIDLLVASPGRLIEMIKKKATNLIRVTYLVLDQADRMLSLGFQQQIRSICSQIREDRQTLLFTATMKQQMQFLLGDIINNPIKITVGEQTSANEDVKQEVVIFNSEEEKYNWLNKHINQLLIEGKILIFGNQRQLCQQIGQYFNNIIGIKALVLHGDKNQYERTMVMNSFKQQGSILIATDIASRGIDVKNIKTVINFDCPKNTECYIHRIGRAGRAGVSGTAISFIMNTDIKFAINLVKVFECSGYPVPPELEDIAILDQVFRRKRMSVKMGISFAKGKDATKLLNHVLKKQKQGYSRAGLGMHQERPKVQHQQPMKLYDEGKLISQQINNSELTISEIASLVREKYVKKNENEIDGHFILAKQNQSKEKYDKPTITFGKK